MIVKNKIFKFMSYLFSKLRLTLIKEDIRDLSAKYIRPTVKTKQPILTCITYIEIYMRKVVPVHFWVKALVSSQPEKEHFVQCSGNLAY